MCVGSEKGGFAGDIDSKKKRRPYRRPDRRKQFQNRAVTEIGVMTFASAAKTSIDEHVQFSIGETEL